MRKIVIVAALAAVCCLAVTGSFAAPPPAQKSGPGTIVIVFKDGHRQAFNLSEIERVEFPASGDAAYTSDSRLPSRSHFLGKWEVGDGSGNNFFITIYDDGTARRSMGNVRGRWVYEDGEARVTAAGHGAPRLGEHTHEVLSQAGLSADEIATLASQEAL